MDEIERQRAVAGLRVLLGVVAFGASTVMAGALVHAAFYPEAWTTTQVAALGVSAYAVLGLGGLAFVRGIATGTVIALYDVLSR